MANFAYYFYNFILNLNSLLKKELEKTEVDPGPDTRPGDDAIDKSADVLHVQDNIQQPRSRRSSGYASASNSPLNKRLTAANKERRSVVIDEDDDKWRMSLYEVTLRWMFDLDDDGDAPSVVNNDAPPSVQIDEAAPPKPIVGDVLANDQRQVIRIYLHLFGKNRSKLPLHIDLEPLLSAADSWALWYAIVTPDDANHAPLPRCLFAPHLHFFFYIKLIYYFIVAELRFWKLWRKLDNCCLISYLSALLSKLLISLVIVFLILIIKLLIPVFN